jgi:hypothetical protein
MNGSSIASAFYLAGLVSTPETFQLTPTADVPLAGGWNMGA